MSVDTRGPGAKLCAIIRRCGACLRNAAYTATVHTTATLRYLTSDAVQLAASAPLQSAHATILSLDSDPAPQKLNLLIVIQLTFSITS